MARGALTALRPARDSFYCFISSRIKKANKQTIRFLLFPLAVGLRQTARISGIVRQSVNPLENVRLMIQSLVRLKREHRAASSFKGAFGAGNSKYENRFTPAR